VHQLKVQKREGGEGTRLWVDDLAGLLGLVEMDAVELQPWNALVDDIENADQMVFDLDPGEGIQWEFVTETALSLRELLRTEGLATWPKMTGGKGLHIMAPLSTANASRSGARYSKAMAERFARLNPARYTTTANIAARQGKLFIDYLRNGWGTAAVGSACSQEFRSLHQPLGNKLNKGSERMPIH
jgi:bifunctional non-homologous end joining protein LigD